MLHKPPIRASTIGSILFATRNPVTIARNNSTVPISIQLYFERKDLKFKTAKKEMLKTEVKYPWGSYKLVLERSVLGEYKYINYAKAIRTPAN